MKIEYAGEPVDVDIDFLRKSRAAGVDWFWHALWNGSNWNIMVFADEASPPMRLCAARGGVREFKTLDAVAKVYKDIGIGRFHVDQ